MATIVFELKQIRNPLDDRRERHEIKVQIVTQQPVRNAARLLNNIEAAKAAFKAAGRV